MSIQICPSIESVTNFDLMSALYRSGIAKEFSLLPSVFSVIMGLANHYNKRTGVVFPSLELLCNKLNMSKPTVIKAINTLIAKRLLLKTKRRCHNVYSFTNVLFNYLKTETEKTRNITATKEKTGKEKEVNRLNSLTSKGKNSLPKQDNVSNKINNTVKNFQNDRFKQTGIDYPKADKVIEQQDNVSNKINNTVKNFQNDRFKQTGIDYPKADKIIEQIKQDKLSSKSPLDMPKSEQIAFYHNMPTFLKTSSVFAQTIKKRFNL